MGTFWNCLIEAIPISTHKIYKLKHETTILVFVIIYLYRRPYLLYIKSRFILINNFNF